MTTKCLDQTPIKDAIHEAGHAAAIYLGNKNKNLPPVYFRIVIETHTSSCQSSAIMGNLEQSSSIRIDGGRLIHTLPSSLEEATKGFSIDQKHAYECAFEADIVNLLAGSLAEAHYVALRDDEPINPHLVNLEAIHYYGGQPDMKIVEFYLECFGVNDEQREKKLTELFLAAFGFVSKWPNWLSITTLANHILNAEKNIIEYNEIIGVLETCSQSYNSTPREMNSRM